MNFENAAKYRLRRSSFGAAMVVSVREWRKWQQASLPHQTDNTASHQYRKGILDSEGRRCSNNSRAVRRSLLAHQTAGAASGHEIADQTAQRAPSDDHALPVPVIAAAPPWRHRRCRRTTVYVDAMVVPASSRAQPDLRIAAGHQRFIAFDVKGIQLAKQHWAGSCRSSRQPSRACSRIVHLHRPARTLTYVAVRVCRQENRTSKPQGTRATTQHRVSSKRDYGQQGYQCMAMMPKPVPHVGAA